MKYLPFPIKIITIFSIIFICSFCFLMLTINNTITENETKKEYRMEEITDFTGGKLVYEGKIYTGPLDKIIFTIYPDGTIKLNEGVTLDEASKAFWDYVKMYKPHLYQPNETVFKVGEKLKYGDKVVINWFDEIVKSKEGL